MFANIILKNPNAVILATDGNRNRIRNVMEILCLLPVQQSILRRYTVSGMLEFLVCSYSLYLFPLPISCYLALCKGLNALDKTDKRTMHMKCLRKILISHRKKIINPTKVLD